MRLSIATALATVSTLALLSSSRVSAALTAQERADYELKNGPEPNYCEPCLQKAMHNHFPHACAADIDSQAANNRAGGSTPEEERCVCVAFRDLAWMKADCSLECPYTHSENAMQYFLPVEQIEGCDKWIDFKTRQEKNVDGFAPRNPDHVPEVFPIAPPPEKPEGQEVEENDGRYKVKVSVGFDKTKKAEELEGEKSKEEADQEAKEEEKPAVEAETQPEAEAQSEAETKKKDQPEAEIKKDEL
ncbi:hypothetical protein BGX34_005617 [Mortierella sp. NVP85]|nr:hypothetical protein BGX34_005617 [Mortierella sp. NVP85]